MSMPRIHATELVRLLNAAKQPIYVLDEDLTIVFLNQGVPGVAGDGGRGAFGPHLRLPFQPRSRHGRCRRRRALPAAGESGGRDFHRHGRPCGRRRHVGRAPRAFPAHRRRRRRRIGNPRHSRRDRSSARFRRRAGFRRPPKRIRSPCTRPCVDFARRPPRGFVRIGSSARGPRCGWLGGRSNWPRRAGRACCWSVRRAAAAAISPPPSITLKKVSGTFFGKNPGRRRQQWFLTPFFRN